MPGRHQRTQNRGEEPAGFVFLPTQNKIGFVWALSGRLVFIWKSRVSSGPGGFQGRVNGSEWSLAPHKCGPPQVAVATSTHQHHADPRAPQATGTRAHPSGRVSCIRGSPGVDEDGEQTPQGHAVSTCCQTRHLLVACGQGVVRSEWLSPGQLRPRQCSIQPTTL